MVPAEEPGHTPDLADDGASDDRSDAEDLGHDGARCFHRRGRLARSLGANVGATPGEQLPRQADRYGQTTDDHPSSRTGPDGAERLTGIYGSEGWGFESLRAATSKQVRGYFLGCEKGPLFC